MRVAFDASSTRGQKTGIGVYTSALMEALARHAPQVETVALSDTAAVVQRTDRRIWREQFVLPKLAAQAHADILHLTGFAAPRRAHMPVVLTVMDLIGVLFPKRFPPAARFYWSRYLPWTLHAPARLITLSEHTKRDIVRLTRVPADKIHVIPPGVDSRFRVLDDAAALNAVRARLRLPAQFFLFVSTLEPRKGIDTLIEAYAQVQAQLAQDLVIVGKRGWYFAELEQRIQTAAPGRIHLTDYVADDDLPFVYNLATAFVFPSRYEGFGLTPLEAMACGTPVISSDAASLPEVIGDAGMLVAPDAPAALARALCEVAADASRRAAMRNAGLARARQFTWERAALSTAELYQAVLDAGVQVRSNANRS